MDDAFSVGGGQTLGNGGTNRNRLAPRHRHRGQAAPQGYAFQQLRDRIGNPLLPTNVKQDQDVRMGQCRDRLGLPLESGQAIGVVG
jgi:hypothetical protein